MKQAIYNKRGTRQIIDTGWKEFDRQTNLITTGNVFANTQYSSYIRPWKETECNGFVNKEGHLMNYDLRPFVQYRMPRHIEAIIRDKDRADSVILYMFFILNEQKQVEPFGWILTDRQHNYLAKGLTFDFGVNARKRLNALLEVRKYITTTRYDY